MISTQDRALRVDVAEGVERRARVELGLVHGEGVHGEAGKTTKKLAALDELEQEEAQVRILVRRVQLEQERVADLRRRRAI